MNDMGTLYLVRHGQASFGADDYDQLSDLGRRQSLKLGEYFAHKGIRFDGLIAGTLRRHKQTLEAILEGMNQAGEHLAWDGLNEYDSTAVIAAIHPQKLERPDSPELYRHHFRLLRDGLAQWMAGVVTPKGMPSYGNSPPAWLASWIMCAPSTMGRPCWSSAAADPISTAVGQVLGTTPETTIELNMRIRNTSITELAFTPKRHMLVATTPSRIWRTRVSRSG